MFSLASQLALLVDVNPRAERHGENTALASDLKFEITAANDILSEFHPTLKSSFYTKGTAAQPQLIDEPGHLPDLRFPFIKEIGWTKEYVGYGLTVRNGLGGKGSDIQLEGCTVNGFRFAMQEGGSVTVTLRIQCHPSERDIGLLCGKIQEQVEISLTPPPVANGA